MAKPIVRKIGILDASKDNTVYVSWSGLRSYALRIVITEASSNTVVWDNKETTYFLSMTIPAGTLTNGVNYQVQAQTFDSTGTASAISDKVGFYTLATPTFAFADIPKEITNSSYLASVNYYSSDGESISSYTFYLYDTTKKQLMKSDTIYNQSDISYTYKGLENNVDYYIRCIGVTVNGLEVDTGYTYISVSIENPSEYARLYATNLPDQGCVQLNTNLVVIQYNGDETFEFEDGRILLDGKKLYYDSGFTIPGDFTLMLKGMGLYKNDTIMTLKNQTTGDMIALSSHIYSDEKLRFNLKAFNGLSTYLIYSDPLSFTNEDEVLIAIRRIGSIYQIKTFLDTDVTDQGDYWWGSLKPTAASDMDQWVDTEGATEFYSKDTVTEFFDDIEPSTAIVGDIWISDSNVSADVSVEEFETSKTLEDYLADYTLSEADINGLNLAQMAKFMQWFHGFIVTVKNSLNTDLLEEFYKWAEKRSILINNWYLKNSSPESLASLLEQIAEDVNSILT